MAERAGGGEAAEDEDETEYRGLGRPGRARGGDEQVEAGVVGGRATLRGGPKEPCSERIDRGVGLAGSRPC